MYKLLKSCIDKFIKHLNCQILYQLFQIRCDSHLAVLALAYLWSILIHLWRYVFFFCDQKFFTVSVKRLKAFTTDRLKMKLAAIWLVCATGVFASIGDNLPAFKRCCDQCNTVLCGLEPELSLLLKFSDYSMDEFRNNHNVHFPLKQLFLWTCESDCDYKCQQLVTNERISQGLPVVKFYGKWPFLRFFGITELASVVFSLLNMWTNYKNLTLISKYHDLNSPYPFVQSMYRQYIYLLVISIMGWVFSTVFHIRDFALTETLDYFGASLIILFNNYVITVRVFQIFNDPKRLQLAKTLFVVVYGLHVLKLWHNWDYTYNVNFHLAISLVTIGLWGYHSINTYRVYNNKMYYIQASNMKLLPLESSILKKLNYLSILGKFNFTTSWIPILPIFFNLWLLLSISFEIFDGFWFKIIDCHAIWHLLTVFPQLLWYHWNAWDLELYKCLHYKTS